MRLRVLRGPLMDDVTQLGSGQARMQTHFYHNFTRFPKNI